VMGTWECDSEGCHSANHADRPSRLFSDKRCQSCEVHLRDYARDVLKHDCGETREKIGLRLQPRKGALMSDSDDAPSPAILRERHNRGAKGAFGQVEDLPEPSSLLSTTAGVSAVSQ